MQYIIYLAYNEEKTLKEIIERVLSMQLPNGFEKEIIIVNDASKDSSWEIIKELESEYKEVQGISNEKNMGKTQTVRNGILQTSGDFVVIQDADLEYDPKEIVDILGLAIEKDLDVVYGNRFGKKNDVIYMQNYLGNKFLSFISNVFTYPRIKVAIPDMEVCYKLIQGDIARDLAKNIVSKSNFGFEPEITAKLSRYKQDGKRLKFGIIPISYYPRSIEEGKKMNAFKDGFKAIIEIIRFNLF
jgi:glycosyltransferase involved in cell wall biosynthesis